MRSAAIVQKVGTSSSSDHVVPGASNSNEVTALLTSLNLQQYIDVFIANGFDDMLALIEMQDVHFQRLGILLGHQLKIMNRIRSYSVASHDGSSSNINAAAAVSSEPGFARDPISGEPCAKRHRSDVAENSVSSVVLVNICFISSQVDFMFRFIDMFSI
jgi:hypothetical protein